MPSQCECGEVVPDRHCPQCGSKNDANLCATDGVTEHVHPASGDVSICLYCSALMIYTEDGLRDPTDEEFSKLRRDPDVQVAIGAIATLRSEGKIPPCRP